MVAINTLVSTTLLALISGVAAQTSTDCNPLDTTCPSDVGLASSSFSTDFTTGKDTSWVAAEGTTITYSDQGAAFTINTKTDAPTISTNFYIFFGYIEVKLRAAPGTGIVSSIVLESDDLDEIDWELLGGNNTSVETNFFGKGNTTAYDRAIYYPVTTPTETYHTYALNWTSSSLVWLIDSIPVRTLHYTDALALNGANYPQTPCRLKIGSWAAGASTSPGTVEWAGGATDFADAPFVMYVDSVSITNYNPAETYSYGDRSGSWESIKIDGAAASNSSAASGTASGSAGAGASVTRSQVTATTLSVAAITATAPAGAAGGVDGSSPASASVSASAALGSVSGSGSGTSLASSMAASQTSTSTSTATSGAPSAISTFKSAASRHGQILVLPWVVALAALFCLRLA